MTLFVVFFVVLFGIATINATCNHLQARALYRPEARSNVRVVPRPFDWAKEEESVK